jgi:glycosyltransferase involved in cell wall biosynthesis
MSKPRITIIRTDSGTRDSRLQKELRMFVEEGCAVTLLCWDREREWPKHEEKDGYTIHRCHLRAEYGSRKLFLLMPLWWVYEFFMLLRLGGNAIHACDFDTVVPALAVRILTGRKVVYDVYDFYSVKSSTIPGPLKKFFRVAEQIAARMADAVVVVDGARSYLFGDRPPKRVEVAMNCPYDAVEPEWKKNAEDAPLLIFYGGAIAEYRGMEKLAEATRDLDHVRVVLAGWITNDRYKKLLDDSPHIEYIGMVNYTEALRWTHEADAVYSYYDPALEINRTANSSKMFDSFMCGTAVLANNEPPAAKVVAEHGCGSSLPFDDDAGLKDVIARWRDHREEARACGQNGRRLFEEELNWNKAADRILGLYRELGILA